MRRRYRTAEEQAERAAMVESLRERYEAGTLDEALFPESPDLLELLADIFPELSRDGPPT